MSAKFHYSVHTINRANGDMEQGVFLDGPNTDAIHLVCHPSRHVSVIDPHEHPLMHPDWSPEEHASRVQRFLDMGGAELLGHPDDRTGITRATEVARVTAKYKLREQPTAS